MSDAETERQPREFQPTRWSIVWGAKGALTPTSKPAVERLVRNYWGPVYWAIRRGWNRTKEDAKDLTQEFFVKFMERGGTEGFDPEKGRFRSFLYAAVKHFMLQERRDRSRLKRGGGQLPFSLDQLQDDGAAPGGASTPPDQVFHQEWVATVLQEATAELREECRLAGKDAHFRVFESYDLAESRPTYEELAQRLSISVNDVHNHLKQMRQRLRELIRAAVLETLSGPEELDDEMRLLFG
jgi:RNA polymerase sigma-70 factor (ECF subfamily)